MFGRIKIGAIAIPALLVSLFSCSGEKEQSSESYFLESDSLFEYRWTGEVIFDDSGNVVEGTRTAYFISGEKFSEVPVKNGRENGTMRVWDQEGIKTADIEFSDGAQNGKSVFWYENGNKRLEIDFVDGFENGTWKTWYPDGALWVEGEVKHGNRVGIWTEWHPNGVKKSEGPYELFEVDRPGATGARLSDHDPGTTNSENDSLMDSISH
ncbi:MAG: toxin-antitoxin system YwqK family antitoxin, partial [candidate division Zixibacteria bacterium]|nr:toxin-antitoxin system YwqK family antitoxin [candidate division Zixibacteria bacterium]